MNKQEIKNQTSQKTPSTRSRSFSPSMRGMSEGQGEFQTTKKAFTLVELIIVITILAILATIAFVSFSNYTASSRDTKRISSLVNIEKGLDIYSVQVGNLPVPSSAMIFTGGLSSEIKQGKLTKDVLQTLGSTPTDPVTNDEYVYSIFGNGKYYQVAGSLENKIGTNLLDSVHANIFQSTKIVGNYKYDPSLPSLIIGSGTNIFSPDTCFLLNGGTDTLENCVTKKIDFSGKKFDSSLVGYWDMETLTGLLLKDLSGNGNHGIFTGAIAPSLTGGFIGNAYNFLETNSGSVEIESNKTLEIENALTISVIIKANKNELKGILTKQSTGKNYDSGSGCSSFSNYCGYQLNTRLNEIGGRVYNKFNPIDRSSVEKFDYKDKYIMLTYVVENNQYSKVFINGILLNTKNKTFVSEISVSKNPLKIGRYWNDYNGGVYEFFDGIIDEVKIYNRTLSNEEIIQQARIAGF